jgi:hypothetical protein
VNRDAGCHHDVARFARQIGTAVITMPIEVITMAIRVITMPILVITMRRFW